MKEKAETKKEKKVADSKVRTKDVEKEKPVLEKHEEQKTKEVRLEKKSMKPEQAIKYAKANSKQRKFVQTWDLIINLKNIDLRKPENRFTFETQLPEGRGKDLKIAFIGDTLAKQAKNYVDTVITKTEIEKYAKNKKTLKKLAKEYDFFLAEAPLMPLVGKSFGIVLGPRGKMPKPVPPGIKLEPIIEASKRSVRIMLKDTPVIHVPIGTEKMEDEKVLKNLHAVYNAVKEKLPKGKNNIKSVFIKLTMGIPVKLEL
jgi:large subunit ribosomal protein L1